MVTGGDSADDPDFSPGGWRDILLGRVLVAFLPITVVAATVAVVAARGHVRLVMAVTLYPACAALALAAVKHRWPYMLRAMTLVSVYMLATFVGYSQVGFQSGPALVVAVAVITAGLFLGRRAMLLVLALAVLAPILTAAGMLQGFLPLPDPDFVAMAKPGPWIRTTFVAAAIWALLGLMVTHVVAHIERGVVAVQASLQRVRAEQSLREQADRQRREAELAALQSQKLEVAGQLAAGVAHDFNNVLAVVQGWGVMGLSAQASPAERAEALEALNAATRLGAALCRQLLTFCRRNVRAVQTLKLSAVVDTSLRALRRVLPENIGLSIAYDHAALVDADDTELQQVLFNLVINARDALPGGGQITISTGIESFPAPRKTAGGGELQAGLWVFVRVEDTGPGIDPDKRERIFEPFFTTKPIGAGTGLGLWTVLGIATASGGGVLVTGEPGRGTRFTVYLPASATRAPAGLVRPTSEMTSLAPRARILLLEDDAPLRRLMTAVLERAGHRVVAVGDGLAAIAEIARSKEAFDLLCSDAVVPRAPAGSVIDAFEKANPSGSVLVVSGYVDEELTRSGIEQGRYHLLRKPFPPDELCKAIDQLRSNAQARGAL